MTDLVARPERPDGPDRPDHTGHPGLSAYELVDRFRREDGRVFLSGVQALARLPVDQLRIDRRHGLQTAAFVSGYQGSPVGSFQEDASRAAGTVPDLPIVVQPGLNEEFGATAVMGSQLVDSLPGQRHDGVVGVWYGKAPGLDRASDAIRHAVFVGTSRHGGVMAVVGDDPAAKSSTLPSSSDATLVDLHMPIMFPGDVQEALDLSRHAIALSRASGMWVGMKLVTPVADGTGTVDVHPDRVRPVVPTIDVDGEPFVPHPNGRLIAPYTLDMEREFQQVRSELARRYGVANGLNRVTVSGERDRIGIAACGHTYHELREALGLLGLVTDDDLRAAGVRLFQLLMPVPVDEQQVRDFAHGLAEVLIVEEKNPTLELLVKSAMYESPDRPRVVGRHDEHGELLIPGTSMLDADRLIEPLQRRLALHVDAERLRPPPAKPAPSLLPLTVARAPFYCSGCPHNRSTRNPEGTLVGGGIGCHAMVALMEPSRVGDLAGLTAMGNEGTQWIGMAPFLDRDHFVQNLGDGTFFHSGSLAIRASVAAGVKITYKLLYNGTVAMTGGQDPPGQLDVPSVVELLLLEGVSKVIVTSDEPDRWKHTDFGPHAGGRVDVRDRTELLDAQAELAGIDGVTVLLHDQACAAEKRRARSRGRMAKPGFRVVINERVCEGCGDCGDKSNCLSVQPVDTPYGRKTRIHQTSCNWDLSCLEGDCPSFATVTVEASAKPDAEALPGLRGQPLDGVPDPVAIVPEDAFTVRLSGIGGTGVVTVSQILGTAAMLEGRVVRGLDQTGLSQKAGPVVSDLRINARELPASNHANSSGVDCLLAFDLLTAASDAHRVGALPERTVVVGSVARTPTGAMVADPTTPYPTLEHLTGRLAEVSRGPDNRYLDSIAVSAGLFGDATTANVMLLGVAVQHGAIAVAPASVERAIELNGVAVERNVAAFRWGRRWAIDPNGVEQAAGLSPMVAETLDELIERLAGDLVGYQDEKYAARFRKLVDEARGAEQRVDPTSTGFTEAVARHAYKLMAYKDEYEVARLLLEPAARAGYEAVGGTDTVVTWRLHPPMLRALGLKRKLELGPKFRPALVALARSKRLRGTLADPFRWAKVRRWERAIVPEYERAVRRLMPRLDAGNVAEAAAIASLPDQVRGYEHIKLRRAETYRQELAARVHAFA